MSVHPSYAEGVYTLDMNSILRSVDERIPIFERISQLSQFSQFIAVKTYKIGCSVMRYIDSVNTVSSTYVYTTYVVIFNLDTLGWWLGCIQ